MEALDAPLVRVPFESLKRAAKERKALVDETSEALSSINFTPGTDARVQQQRLQELEQRLQGIKRKLVDVGLQEQEEAQRCKVRLDHLSSLGAPPPNGAVAWNKQRLDRLLVDHLLRAGHFRTASSMAKACACEQLADLRPFQAMQPVIAALQAHNCGPALAWCTDNRARLKKIKSNLEFKLRLQEFIELVRQDRRLEALYYARQHLAPRAQQHMAELSRALATLALTARTRAAPYQQLFAQGQWGALLAQLFRDLYRLHGMPADSQMAVHLQAGLVALKAPHSSSSSSSQPPAAAGNSTAAAAAAEAGGGGGAGKSAPQQQQQSGSGSGSGGAGVVAGGGGNKEDPLHLPSFQALAAGLPYSKHTQSKLICSVTGELMTDANPPMVLPNGFVYSQKAVAVMMAKHGGKVVCPHTGQAYSLDELRRAFIV